MPAGKRGRTHRNAGTSAGFSLAELVVALALLAVLTTILFAALTTHARLARLLARRVLETDAVRTAATVLGSELRRIHPDDLRGVGRDSLALRAFRGTGTVCGAGPGGGVIVHFRGDRTPEPAKDSVLWIGSGGPPATAALVEVRPTPIGSSCAGVAAGEVHFWRTEPPLTRRGVLLVYESGTYYLTAGALRYRLGGAGRQPLTAELLVHPPTGFGRRAPNVVQVFLATSETAAFPAVVTVHYGLLPPPR